MPRNMSVAMTIDAVKSRRKTVTRRAGWRFLKPGDRLMLCEKCQGRKPGEPLVRLAEVEVVSVRRERLDAMTTYETASEGFPGMLPGEFIRRFFTDAQGMAPSDEVTRIEWRYLDSVSPEDRAGIAEEVDQERTADADSWYQEHPEEVDA